MKYILEFEFIIPDTPCERGFVEIWFKKILFGLKDDHKPCVIFVLLSGLY